MSTPKPFSKSTFDLGGEGSAAAIHLPIEPHGVAVFVAPDASIDSNKLINEVVAVWHELWPTMRTYLKTEMEEYGVDAVLGTDDFIGSINRMSPDVFMGDQSNIMIRLEFEEPPLWDFFIRGAAIVHSQPVF